MLNNLHPFHIIHPIHSLNNSSKKKKLSLIQWSHHIILFTNNSLNLKKMKKYIKTKMKQKYLHKFTMSLHYITKIFLFLNISFHFVIFSFGEQQMIIFHFFFLFWIFHEEAFAFYFFEKKRLFIYMHNK